MKKSLVIQIIVNVVTVGFMFMILEGICAFLMNNPTYIPNFTLKAFRDFYRVHDRYTIQVLPECAGYDEGLFYTLKPGNCRFENREFDTTVSANSLGTRDDEESLEKPEIVLLGDSFTMGWGVEEDETFGYQVEQRAGSKLLNAGVSSFGTVREMKLLERIDTDSLKYLIIQYHQNDYEENQEYLEGNNNLIISSRQQYDDLIESVADRIGYYFGKYTTYISKFTLKNFLSQSELYDTGEGPRNIPNEVNSFLNVLMNSKVKLEGVQLVVFEIGSYADNDNRFSKLLGGEIRDESYPDFIRNARILDMTMELNQEHFFILDDHLNAAGNQIVANNIVTTLNQ